MSKKVRVRKFKSVENLGRICPFYFSIQRRKNHRCNVIVSTPLKGQAPNFVPSNSKSYKHIDTIINVVSKSSEVQFSGGSIL